jgi:hypothetical protein
MVRLTLCLQLLLLVLILQESDANNEQCRKLLEERDRLEEEEKFIMSEKHENDQRFGRCKVSVYFTVHLSSSR